MVSDARTTRRLLLPIRVGLDPMEKLLVASFRGDPEFEAFEPQVFDDAVNGRGMRVLRYRKDGRVDVYRQHGIRVDTSTFVVGAGIGDFAEVAIEPARVAPKFRSWLSTYRWRGAIELGEVPTMSGAWERTDRR